jgi:hypothetical protein
MFVPGRHPNDEVCGHDDGRVTEIVVQRVAGPIAGRERVLRSVG